MAREQVLVSLYENQTETMGLQTVSVSVLAQVVRVVVWLLTLAWAVVFENET